MTRTLERPNLPVTVLSGFLGADMDEAAIRRRLDACLVGDADAEAMQPAAWKRLKDPFPAWKRAEQPS